MYTQSDQTNHLATLLLDGYVGGTLPEHVRAWIESRLTDDAALRSEVEAHRLAIAAIRERGRRDDAALGEALGSMTQQELEQLLARMRDKHAAAASSDRQPLDTAVASRAADQTPSPEKKFLTRRLIGNTLAVAALMSGVWFGARLFYRNQGAQETADTYIAVRTSTTPAQGQARGTDEPLAAPHDWSSDTLLLDNVAPQYSEVETAMAEAEHLMQNGLYNEAIALLEPIYRDSNGQREVGLMLATAYVKAKDSSKANELLQALAEQYEGDPEIEALSKAYAD